MTLPLPKPAITVAMGVYNNAPYLPAAIESILDQTFGDFEFLIVNDGSTDGSGEIIDSYAAADSRVRAIHQDNRGLVPSLNRIIAEARAPLIARMDGDDISLPGRFARQLAFMADNPEYGVVGTWATSMDEEGRLDTIGGMDQPTDWEQFKDSLWGKPLMCHPAVIAKTDVLRRVGGYRPCYRYCEDYDLWLRLAEVTRLCSIPERLFLYRYSDGQVSNRHIVQQTIGAAVAWHAREERLAGRPDPTQGLERLPPLEELDALFGRPGVSKAVRDRVAPGLVYSKVAMGGEGFGMLIDHVREGGGKDGLWRTAARLVKMGKPARAVRLAKTLVTA
jgi:hypothetical protein